MKKGFSVKIALLVALLYSPVVNVHAQASEPSSATAQVTEHTKTESEQSEQGKEFYTIQTKSEKVFYLIIDRDEDEETVYFLTEISEDDLLNVIDNETSSQDSIVVESAIPTIENVLENDKVEEITEEEIVEEIAENEQMEELEETSMEKENPVMLYFIFAVLGVVTIGFGYYFKLAKKKDEQFLDEEDDEEELLEEDEEGENDSEDDFFTDDEEGEEE